MVKEYMKKYDEDIKNCKNDWKNIKTWYRQIPNLLTLSRPVGMIPVNILFLSGHQLAAIVLTGLLLITDCFDGKLARKWNVQSQFGADLDAACDKITFLGLSLPLIISNPLLLINLFFEAIIAGINVYGRVKGLDTKTVFSGKIKMWFLSVTLGVGYLSHFLTMPSIVLDLFIYLTGFVQLLCVKDYVMEVSKMEKDIKNINSLDKELTLNNEIILEEQLEKEIVKTSIEPIHNERTFDADSVSNCKKKVRTRVKKKNI